MSKGTFVVAAVLALSISPAWAGDEEADLRGGKDAVARAAGTDDEGVGKSGGESARKDASVRAAEAGRDSGAVQESSEVRASFDEQWLRMREGYRDGGY